MYACAAREALIEAFAPEGEDDPLDEADVEHLPMGDDGAYGLENLSQMQTQRLFK